MAWCSLHGIKVSMNAIEAHNITDDPQQTVTTEDYELENQERLWGLLAYYHLVAALQQEANSFEHHRFPLSKAKSKQHVLY